MPLCLPLLPLAPSPALPPSLLPASSPAPCPSSSSSSSALSSSSLSSLPVQGRQGIAMITRLAVHHAQRVRLASEALPVKMTCIIAMAHPPHTLTCVSPNLCLCCVLCFDMCIFNVAAPHTTQHMHILSSVSQSPVVRMGTIVALSCCLQTPPHMRASPESAPLKHTLSNLKLL